MEPRRQNRGNNYFVKAFMSQKPGHNNEISGHQAAWNVDPESHSLASIRGVI